MSLLIKNSNCTLQFRLFRRESCSFFKLRICIPRVYIILYDTVRLSALCLALRFIQFYTLWYINRHALGAKPTPTHRRKRAKRRDINTNTKKALHQNKQTFTMPPPAAGSNRIKPGIQGGGRNKRGRNGPASAATGRDNRTQQQQTQQQDPSNKGRYYILLQMALLNCSYFDSHYL